MLYKSVGKVLKTVQKEKGFKYLRLCDENDIKTSTFDNIINGKTQAYFSSIAKIIKGLGMNFEEFGARLDKALPDNFWEDED